MKISFKSSFDDRLREMRFVRERPGDTTKYLRNRIIIIGVAAVLVGVLATTDAAAGVGLVLLSGVFFLACAYPYRRAQRNHLYRAVVLARDGSAEPMDAAFELHETGIVSRRGDKEITSAWEKITSVRETSDAIELRSQGTGAARIPTRIFESSSQRAEWLEFIRSRVKGQGA